MKSVALRIVVTFINIKRINIDTYHNRQPAGPKRSAMEEELSGLEGEEEGRVEGELLRPGWQARC